MKKTSKITYAFLLNKRLEEINEKGGNAPIAKSALILWINFFGLKLETEIGSEFNEEYQVCLEKFLSTQENESTKNNYKSRIGQWVEYYVNLLPEPDIEKTTFADFLKRKMYEKDLSLTELMRTTKIYSGTLQRWLQANRIPSNKKSNKALKRLSVALGLPEDYLIKNFVLLLKKHTRKKDFIPKSKFERTCSKNRKNTYGINDNDLESPPLLKVKTEFEQYYIYKTRQTLPFKMTRNSSWFVKPDGTCKTADMFKAKIYSFFGCLKIKFKKDEYRLSDMTDPTFLSCYYEFFKERLGYVSSTTSEFVGSVCSPLIEFYRNYPELLLDNKDHYLVKEIQEKYDLETPKISLEQYFKLHIKQELSEFLSNLEGQAKPLKDASEPGRLPDEKISDWLKLPSPLRPIIAAVSDMKKDYQKLKFLSTTNKIHNLESVTLLRDIAIIDILIEKPVRDASICEIQFEQELVKIGDVWQLKLQPHQVKNRKFVEFIFSEEASTSIDMYYKHHKEINPDSNYLFKTSHKEKNADLYSKLSDRIEMYTGRAIGPHAFRTIRATDFLKNFEDGYIYAAEILGDEFKTVYDNYCKINIVKMSSKDAANIQSIRNEFKEESETIRIYTVKYNDQTLDLNHAQEKCNLGFRPVL